MDAHILETKGISKVYVEGEVRVQAVDSVSIALKRGEVLLIMGPSGSGKTTLLSMMGCILHPTAGDVIVDDRVVSSLKEDALPDIRKKYFGFVFQSFNLFPSLTARENVEVILRLKRRTRDRLKSESSSLLEKVGLGEREDFYPRDLSGGEKQRVAFARALAGDPPIILADEPTANLDTKKGKEILELLKALAVESEKAVVIVSHDPRASSLAHRVVLLEDGRIRS